MKVKFRNKTLNIENISKKRNEFYAQWNYYSVEIFQNEYYPNFISKEYWKEHRYYVCVTNPMGSCIVDGSEFPTQSKCLQHAFDNIDLDLQELENLVSEKGQLIQEQGTEILEDIEEVEYWLKDMSY